MRKVSKVERSDGTGPIVDGNGNPIPEELLDVEPTRSALQKVRIRTQPENVAEIEALLKLPLK
jgi:hypothetical protein